MQEEITQTVYFREEGKLNTDRTLKLAKKRAEKLGIKNIVVASYSGETGVKASEVFKDFNRCRVTWRAPLLPLSNQILSVRTGELVRRVTDKCHRSASLECFSDRPDAFHNEQPTLLAGFAPT